MSGNRCGLLLLYPIQLKVRCFSGAQGLDRPVKDPTTGTAQRVTKAGHNLKKCKSTPVYSKSVLLLYMWPGGLGAAPGRAWIADLQSRIQKGGEGKGTG